MGDSSCDNGARLRFLIAKIVTINIYKCKNIVHLIKKMYLCTIIVSPWTNFEIFFFAEDQNSETMCKKKHGISYDYLLQSLGNPTFRVIRQSCRVHSLNLKYLSSLNPNKQVLITSQSAPVSHVFSTC